MSTDMEIFKQDIENLAATLKSLNIKHSFEDINVQMNVGTTTIAEIVPIPQFPFIQFLGRLCMMLEEVQAKFKVPDNEGLVPHCQVHGENPPTMCVGNDAYCVECIGEHVFKDHKCGWVAPVQEEEIS